MKDVKTFLQILLFIPLQIVMIPFMIVGICISLYKEMVVGKRMGVSFSAGQALQYRYYMHYFDTRPDPMSVEFVKAYPCESHFGMFSVMGALILAQRWFGFRTTFSRMPERGKETLDKTAAGRVRAFDEIMEKYVEQVDQIVMPGSGYDLMALRFTKGKPVKVFEVDQTKTLEAKVDTMTKAGIDHDWITYVPVDFDSESWSDKLVAAGFDPSKRTLFIWQTVSLFLDEALIKEILSDMKSLCSEGSIIAQDFYSKWMVFDDTAMANRSTRNTMKKNGEPWKFAIDMSEQPRKNVESFLESCGLPMTNYMQFGVDLDIKPNYCIVESHIE